MSMKSALLPIGIGMPKDNKPIKLQFTYYTYMPFLHKLLYTLSKGFRTCGTYGHENCIEKVKCLEICVIKTVFFRLGVK